MSGRHRKRKKGTGIIYVSGHDASELGYAPQLIWLLGTAVESKLTDTTLQHRIDSPGTWYEACALVTSDLPLGLHERRELLTNVSYANAQALRTASVVGIAVDDGRCGRRPWKLTAMVIPGIGAGKGTASWLCPQA